MGAGHGDDDNNKNNTNNGSCDESNFSNGFTSTSIFTIVAVSPPL